MAAIHTDISQGLGCGDLLLLLPWLHPVLDAGAQRCRPHVRELRDQAGDMAQQRADGGACTWLDLVVVVALWLEI